MPLLSAKVPGNVILVFKGFTDIVNLKVLDYQQFFDQAIGRLIPSYSNNINT